MEEVRNGADGEVFTVVGTVANGTAESGNAFFNTIYIQDENGNGINVFPIDDNTIRRGDRVQVTGSISAYNGDKQLSAIGVTVLDGTGKVVITDMTTKEANDYEANFGKLVRIKGTVKSVRMASGLVDSIEVADESGEACRVFIDGYIGYSDGASQALEEFVKEGAVISAVGFVSHDAEGNRLRVRDRSEIVLAEAGSDTPEQPDNPDEKPGAQPDVPSGSGDQGSTGNNGGNGGSGSGSGESSGGSGSSGHSLTSTPKTGDTAAPLVWLLILLAAGGAAAAVAVSMKKKKEENRMR